MADCRKSRGHILFLRLFREPRNIDDLPPWLEFEWKDLLGEEPKAAIKRFLDSGVLVSASLSERVDTKFKVTELRDMLKGYGLGRSGNKDELILRLIQAHREDMEQAVRDITVLKCSEQGWKLIEHLQETDGLPPIADGMSTAEKTKTVAKWVLAVGAGVLSNAVYEALKKYVKAEDAAPVLPAEPSKSFRNPHEYDAEYILIPGGQHCYSVTKKVETVQDMYFAKYPVTNKRYRRFIRYLEEKERELLEMLPKPEFDRLMIKSISGIKGFTKYLGDKPNGWPDKLRSECDTNEWFSGENQPVVGVSWFGAQAYCYWLSAFEAVNQDSVFGKTVRVYRLPTAVEWEWAAGGSKRKYPWGNREPNQKLANYQHNVGATTPLGRYPGGATPEGLMDMAGNVWEWMESWYERVIDCRSLRGGSWDAAEICMLCVVSSGRGPVARDSSIGFRVVRSQP